MSSSGILASCRIIQPFLPSQIDLLEPPHGIGSQGIYVIFDRNSYHELTEGEQNVGSFVFFTLAEHVPAQNMHLH